MPVTVRWAQCLTRPVLMIPGPTELPPPVIQALNQPPTIQYDRSFDEGVLEPTTQALGEELPVFGTQYTLRYDSSRATGRADTRRIEVDADTREFHDV